MKLHLQTAAVLFWLMIFPAFAQETAPATKPQPPDKTKLSYALGMHMGQLLKTSQTNVNPNIVAQAVGDVLEGKPTEMQEDEIPKYLNEGRTEDKLADPAASDKDRDKISYASGMRIGLHLKGAGADLYPKILIKAIKDVIEGKPTEMKESDVPDILMQQQAYALSKKAEKNKTSGEVFLAKNAKEPGIHVLPDGLQYRVIEAGAGKIPTTNDLVIVKYHGRFTDGIEFDHHNGFLTRSDGGIQGWQDALQRMKVGAKWEVFIPSKLAFGSEGQTFHHIGPDAVLIYDLELVSIASPNDNLQISSGVGRGADVNADATPANSAK